MAAILAPFRTAYSILANGYQPHVTQQYLNNASLDSVRTDLLNILSPPLWREKLHIQRIFNDFSENLKSIAEETSWDLTCFQHYLRQQFPPSTISETAIDLLWRSLCFCASFPFPNVPPESCAANRIDFPAFHRAVLLLAHNRASHLGKRDPDIDDWYVRGDTASHERDAWWRMFRSIAPHLPSSSSMGEGYYVTQERGRMVADVVDVLAMTVPSVVYAETPDEGVVERAAKRFLADGATVGRRPAAREDIVTLVGLLLRMQPAGDEGRAVWEHGGAIREGRLGDAEMLEAIVDEVLGKGVEQLTTDEQLQNAMGVNPNLLGRFHQLWKIIFAANA